MTIPRHHHAHSCLIIVPQSAVNLKPRPFVIVKESAHVVRGSSCVVGGRTETIHEIEIRLEIEANASRPGVRFDPDSLK